MKRMASATRRAMSLLLTLLLVFSALPAPALAEMAEESMEEEPVATVTNTGRDGGAKRQKDDMGETSAATTAREPADPEPPSDELMPQSDELVLESVPDADPEPDASALDVAETSAELLQAQATIYRTTTVSLGISYTAAVTSDGSLWMWGDNWAGQLGNGTTAKSTRPVYVMGDVTTVSLGGYHTAAVTSDGSLWTWGYNGAGQLGDGTTTKCYWPAYVMDDVAAVSLGDGHSAAIKTDGSLWTWGSNWAGQLGDGTTTDRCSPVKIMDGVVAVSLGGYHSAAIKADGSLWMWGCNDHGQLGDGTTTDRCSPVKVMDGVKAVSLGYGHSAALGVDGSLCTWGRNTCGVLGDGTTAERHYPARVMTGVAAISMGYGHSAAITNDGSLWTWGYNLSGELGDGTTVDRHSPVRVLSGVTAVSLGGSHSSALKSDGSLWTFGDNGFGQIGDGTNSDRQSPVRVMTGVALPVDPDPYRPFPDVASRAWYADVVWRAAALGFMSGYGDGRFGPNESITRGQVAVVLWKMAGQCWAGAGARYFPDVASYEYYYQAVCWASSVGIVSGYGNGMFGPNDRVNREQLAVMLANYAQYFTGRSVSGSTSDYYWMSDCDRVSFWAVPAVGWCFRNGILSGSNGQLRPQGNASRAEAAKMVVGLYDLLG